MRVSEIICEDISTTEAHRHIVDAFTTELPGLLQRLGIMADKFATNYTPKKENGRYEFNAGSYGKSLNFTLGSQRSTWYQDVFWPRARPSVYALTKLLPADVRQRLMQFLLDDSNNTFGRIRYGLIPILKQAAAALRDKQLARAAAIGSQNASVEGIVNDVLGRLSKRDAGDIAMPLVRAPIN